VLVECAYFNPESIIGKSIKYNLVSDAAHKFERGVDIACTRNGFKKICKSCTGSCKNQIKLNLKHLVRAHNQRS